VRPGAHVRHWLRRVLLAVLAVLVGAGAGAGLYQVSLQPGAALIRAVFEAGAEVTPPSGFADVAADVTETHRIVVSAPGAPVAHLDVYAPRAASADPRPMILWIHGGGFISSSADTVKDYAILLAQRGYVVGNLDYTLAPSARYPVPVVQADAALRVLSGQAPRFNGDPAKMFVGGDSAGAQIASEVAAVQTNPALAAKVGVTGSRSALAGVVLFCGLYDMDTVASTGFPALRTYLWAYTGSRDWSSYSRLNELSTTRTATSAFPATFLTVGDADPFDPQAAELARALKAKGVPVTTLFWNGTGDGLGHEYQFDFALPQAKQALEATVAFLQERSR
jgi:acetyl esterase/lipase